MHLPLVLCLISSTFQADFPSLQPADAATPQAAADNEVILVSTARTWSVPVSDMPYSLHTSYTGVPASVRLTTVMISLSEKRNFFMKPDQESLRWNSI